MSDPELSRPIKPRALPAQPVRIEPSIAERRALAERFVISALPEMVAEVCFEQKDDAVVAKGRLNATIIQPCAVTGEDLCYDVAEDFELRFVPQGQRQDHDEDEEFELAFEDLDEIEYEGDSFDIGEAVAQTLGLAIDPYREGPGADAIRETAGIESDENRKPDGPLAEALAGLRKG